MRHKSVARRNVRNKCQELSNATVTTVTMVTMVTAGQTGTTMMPAPPKLYAKTLGQNSMPKPSAKTLTTNMNTRALVA